MPPAAGGGGGGDAATPAAAHSSVEEPFDDGWTGTIVVRHRGPASGRVEVVDGALPIDLAAEAYQHTVALGRSWGDYVSLEEAESAAGVSARAQHSLARRIIRAVWLTGERAAELLTPERHRVHGFAIWANAGDVGEECSYHLDYAELHRRRSGRLHPPLLASTVHVSALGAEGGGSGGSGGAPGGEGERICGGVFGVNTRGLEHYREFGHHGVLARDRPGALEEDWASDARWVKVPYRACRAILFDGSLPHRATPTTYLPPGRRRVVIGINVFDVAVGEQVAAAPVHSEAYREQMAALQAFTRVPEGGGGTNHKIVAMGGEADAATAQAEARQQACVQCGGRGVQGAALPFRAAGQWFCGARCLKAYRGRQRGSPDAD